MPFKKYCSAQDRPKKDGCTTNALSAADQPAALPAMTIAGTAPAPNTEKEPILSKLEEIPMNFPVWTKPGVYGALVGAAALAFVGFNWGGWVTAGTANKIAEDQARAEVVAALVPICVAQSKLDPNAVNMLAELMKTTRYQRSDMLMEAGWATMPGSTDPNRNVATACMEELAAQF